MKKYIFNTITAAILGLISSGSKFQRKGGAGGVDQCRVFRMFGEKLVGPPMLIHKNNRAMNKHLLDVQVYLSLDNYRLIIIVINQVY